MSVPQGLLLTTITSGHAVALRHIVPAAARCWRAARDQGAPRLPRLHALLSAHDRGMLAPAFDSLLTLYEAALGRAIVVGDTALSDDERRLLGLLDGSLQRHACLDCDKGSASTLDCALCSTRLMVAMAATATRAEALQ